MFAYEPVHNFPASRERPQRPYLVLAHKARIAGYVSREDGCELPFDPLFVSWLHQSSLPLGNGAPGAVKVQAGRFRRGRRRAAIAPPERETSLLNPCRITDAH